MEHTVITIARSYGSGGRTLGKLLAEELGIHCYDRELLRMASEQSGINEALFGQVDEKIKSSPLFRISKKIYKGEVLPPDSDDFTSEDNLFNFQAQCIKELARTESCIIIGRCADYVLDGFDGLVKVYLYADMDYRVERIKELGYYEPKDVKKNIKRIDRERRDYHRYYTGRDWENVENYDLMLNTARLGTEGAVEAVKGYLRLRGYEI